MVEELVAASASALVGAMATDAWGAARRVRQAVWPTATTRSHESLAAASDAAVPGEDRPLVVADRNRGGRAGREVVQVYLEGRMTTLNDGGDGAVA